MTGIPRRELLTTLAAAAGGLGTRAEACTLVARARPKPFSDAQARSSLRDLVALINAAPQLTDAVLSERASSLQFDTAISDELLDYPNRSPIETSELLRAWTQSDGKPDRAPVRLVEVTLLKADRGVALYQFALLRDQFHAENDDDCFGFSPAGFAAEKRAYLGVFRNNKLRRVQAFPEWLETL